MIKIRIKETEVFNVETNEFVSIPGRTFRFENSLKAISKWEQKWNLIFLREAKNLTEEQMDDYFCCMCLDEGFDSIYLTPDVKVLLANYIKKKQTATTFHSQKNTSSKGRITYSSEVIYAHMVLANIPFECDEWNIDRLFSLLNAVSLISSPKKKMPKSEVRAMYNRINERNKKKYNSRG